MENNVRTEFLDNVAVVTIDRPKALNALNTEVISKLSSIFTELDKNEDVACVIIKGEGRAFVAGADIEEMLHMDQHEGEIFGSSTSKIFSQISNFRKPVIACVNGYALGGGLELALACDIRYASKEAKFGFPELGLGITPGFSGTQRLPRVVGNGIAKEMLFTSKIIDAEEAYRIGLVNKIFNIEELCDECIKLATEIASKAQIALEYCKTAVDDGLQLSLEDGIVLESKNFGKCFATEDQVEGMKAFLEKRPAKFKNK